MKIRQNTAIVLSGLIWMFVGAMLLMKGFSFLLSTAIEGEPVLLPLLKSWTGSLQQGTLILVVLGLFIGFLKGRLVLSKTAKKMIARIVSLPNPSPITDIYPRSYFLLLAGMLSLGVLIKWAPVPYDVRGLIDVAIGSALTNGSAFYFRHLAMQKKSV